MSSLRAFALALALVAGAGFAQQTAIPPAPTGVPQRVAPAPFTPPAIAAPSYTLIDVTSGQTILAHNADERRDPASLTKLMTAYLAFAALREKTVTPSQVVQVSQTAWR